MKKYICAGFFGFICVAQSVSGVLPPFYETRNEFKALLDSTDLEGILGSGEGIWEIKRNEEGFLVTSTKYTLQVKVVYEQTKLIGPAKFHLEFGKARSRSLENN